MGLGYFKRFYSLVDILYITTNIAIFYYYVAQMLEIKIEETIDFENHVKKTRQFISLGTMINVVKCGYYLQMSNKISPFMDIVSQICYDLRYFTLIVVLYMWGFTLVFHTLAKNQIDFDQIPEDQIEDIRYNTMIGSAWFVFDNFILQNTDASTFSYGLHS